MLAFASAVRPIKIPDGNPARGRMMTTARYLFDVGLYGVSRIRHRATNIAVNTLSIFISSVDGRCVDFPVFRFSSR